MNILTTGSNINIDNITNFQKDNNVNRKFCWVTTVQHTDAKIWTLKIAIIISLNYTYFRL